MKKKSIALFSLLLLVAFTLFFATGCDTKDALNDKIKDLQDQITGLETQLGEPKNITVILANSDDIPEEVYKISTKTDFLHQALVEQKNKGVFSYIYSAGDNFDAFVTGIGRLASSTAPNGLSGTYIALYHSLRISGIAAFDPTIGEYGDYATKKVGETTYYYANVGFSLLPVVNGATYYIALETWG